MKPVYFLFLVAVLLASCSSAPSGDAVQTAIAQTQIAQPTNTLVPIPTNTPTPEPTSTPTPIPLSELDLEPILVMPGDLPAGYSAAQVSSDPPAMFNDVPQPVNQIYQQFEQDNESAGGVAILVYDNQSDVDTAYNNLLEGMGETSKSVSGVGDRASAVSFDYSAVLAGAKGMDLLVSLCNTIIHTRITGSDNIDYLISYAQRLDERLTPLVCR
jgi:hypothetical protein